MLYNVMVVKKDRCSSIIFSFYNFFFISFISGHVLEMLTHYADIQHFVFSLHQ